MKSVCEYRCYPSVIAVTALVALVVYAGLQTQFIEGFGYMGGKGKNE